VNADRWKHVENCYHAAMERPVPERAEFLAQACANDPELRREVQSLLDQKADSYLESAPVSVIKALSPGAKLGNFEIVELIGRGGMGEVYRAHDPRMRRDVAIKVSAERFSDRFSREVHAAAALNHPNICTLYDVGPNYLVMELLEGETLHHRLSRGPLEFAVLVDVGLALADALGPPMRPASSIATSNRRTSFSRHAVRRCSTSVSRRLLHRPRPSRWIRRCHSLRSSQTRATS
jgi:hypothetical protein